MIPKPLHAIDLGDLHVLIGMREKKTLEFKREVSRHDIKKITAGVSALANTSGGDFVIGIAEKDGLAERIEGIEVNGDGFKETIERVLESGIEPKLPNVDVHAVQCDANRWVFVIRTTRSWLGPHRCLADNHFYVRTSGSTVRLDVAELRTAFGLRESGIERIEAFRRDRLAKIMAGETPVRLQEGAQLVLHLAPLPSFINRDLLDLADVIPKGSHMPVPLGGQGRYAAMNLLGLYNHLGDDGQGAAGYGQLFRSGAYEGVAAETAEDGGHRYVVGTELANTIVGAVRRYIALQEHYQFDFPTFGMISLCNAAGLHMLAHATSVGSSYLTRPLRDDVVVFPEFVIENTNVDVPQLLRAPLNVVWNAFELPSCQVYNQQGGWMGVA